MDESFTLFSFMSLLFLSSMFPIPPTSAFSSTHLPSCHDDERSALLQLKESFIIDLDHASSDDPFASPKVESWKLNGAASDCCSWDGVECDHLTGHVNGLDLSSSCLYGSINSSSSLFRLVHLRKLNLAFNHFNYSQIPPAVGLLSKLVYLNMSSSFLSGPTPSNVSVLSGPFPTSLINLTDLTSLDLSYNRLQGSIPKSISQLRNLEYLNLQGNSFSGTLEWDIFLKLEKLQRIFLSFNNLTLIISTSSNNTFQKFLSIGFGDCKLDVFPDFLRYQDKLEYLDLSMNSIAGQIPKWLWNTSTDSLQLIDFSSNFLTGFEAHSLVFPWVKATDINLDDNLLQSSPPLPPALVETYSVARNKLTGEIPLSFCNLTSLHGLEMGDNQLSGRLPSCLGNFSTNLEALSLGTNDFYGKIPLTLLSGSNLRMIKLGYNQLQGEVPRSLSNCTMLEFLDIGNNQIRDVFPSWLGPLPHLKVLILRSNQFHGVLTGTTTEFDFQKLSIIDLSRNNFTGQLPTQYFFNWEAMKAVDGDQLRYQEILENFVAVDLSRNRFEGDIPGIIGSLQGLRLLKLSHNNLSGDIPSTLASLTRLESLDLSQNKLTGEIPSFSRRNLRIIQLSYNQLQGEVPRSLSNCTMLEFLDIGNNQIHDVFPSWLGALPHLKVLILRSNQFRGVLTGTMAEFEFQKLSIIDLSRNNFTGQLPTQYLFNWVAMKAVDEDQLTYMAALGMDDVRMSYDIYNFLYSILITSKGIEREYQEILENFVAVDLSCNRFEGDIPGVIGSLQGLRLLNLSHNNLSGDIPSTLANLTRLDSLDLSQNKLSGAIPQQLAQLNSLAFFDVSHNLLAGPIPLSFCNLTSLYALEMGDNHLSGRLPSCLGNFSTNLEVLNLGSNAFYGTVPLTFSSGSSCRIIKLSYNKLQGEVPRSLSNCTKLEFLNIGNNQIHDVFPSWLGALPHLKVLILRSNQFHGVLTGTMAEFQFQKLSFIDLSRNNFTGQLPTQYLFNWVAMKAVDEDQLTYMAALGRGDVRTSKILKDFIYSTLTTSKGTEREYQEILENFVAVDLSCNRFEGDIPAIIGNLQGLRRLNLSHNNLSGDIPSSLSNLKLLESLDLSQNELSGEIPWQLAQLNFLDVFNVSGNLLAGPIPQGNQFYTFQNDSYQENLGLCGNPLSKKCGNSEARPRPPPGPDDEEDSSSLLGFGWESVAIGYASGLVFGLVIGYIVVTRHFEWFAMTFRVRVKRTRRARNRTGRN